MSITIRKSQPITNTEADELIAHVCTDTPLEEWQKVILRGFLTGMSPVTLSRARKDSSPHGQLLYEALTRIEEARRHGIA